MYLTLGHIITILDKAEQLFHMEPFVQIYYIKQIRYHLL